MVREAEDRPRLVAEANAADLAQKLVEYSYEHTAPAFAAPRPPLSPRLPMSPRLPLSPLSPALATQAAHAALLSGADIGGGGDGGGASGGGRAWLQVQRFASPAATALSASPQASGPWKSPGGVEN